MTGVKIMNLTPRTKRNIAINLIGYGDPNARLWLMGYEESGKGGWLGTTDGRFLEMLNGFSEIDFKDLVNSNKLSTYGGYCNIISSVFPTCKDGEPFFVTNLFPFGKQNNRVNLSQAELEMFGYDNNLDLDNLIDNYRALRFEVLLSFFKEYKWENKYILFCVGNDNNKEKYLLEFLSKLYNVKKEDLLGNIFAQVDSLYLYHDIEMKKFISYQASYDNYNRLGVLEAMQNIVKF